MLHKTHLPLTLWFWAAYLVATHGPGISALQLQRQLGIPRYETAWTILHKLRRAMVAPEREPLTGEVEVDEGFLGGRDTDLRGGRQRDGKPLVGVAVEVRGSGSGRLRLQLLPDASAASLTSFVCSSVAAGAIVHTDGWHGYDRLRAAGFDHRPRKQRARFPDREWVLPCTPSALQPQDLAARNPPRRLAEAPPGLSRRVRLPPQPPPHTPRRLPNTARPRPANPPPTARSPAASHQTGPRSKADKHDASYWSTPPAATIRARLDGRAL